MMTKKYEEIKRKRYTSSVGRTSLLLPRKLLDFDALCHRFIEPNDQAVNPPKMI
jgi:hypothetical protein